MTSETYERGRDFVISAALHWQQFPTPPPDEESEAWELSETDV
jgi:hypothetical protein